MDIATWVFLLSLCPKEYFEDRLVAAIKEDNNEKIQLLSLLLFIKTCIGDDKEKAITLLSQLIDEKKGNQFFINSLS